MVNEYKYIDNKHAEDNSSINRTRLLSRKVESSRQGSQGRGGEELRGASVAVHCGGGAWAVKGREEAAPQQGREGAAAS